MAAACLICGHDRSDPLVERSAIPVFQNAVYADPAAARGAMLGDLAFRRCAACGFARNTAFAPERLTYGPGYENSQSLSPAFQAHLRERAQACAALLEGRSAPVIVEVGCGQGDFLPYLSEAFRTRGKVRLYGFDPAWRGAEGGGVGGARVSRRLFDESALPAGRVADLIVSRHVIEHIADPAVFLAGLRRCAGPDTRLAIETPDVDWIVRTGAFHDFFYEHCSLFTAAALDQALSRAGFLVTRLERLFGGQYLWAEATAAPRVEATDFGAYRATWNAALADAAARGPVVVWGAGAKGASFVQLLDPAAERIAAVVDINPAKQNRFLGGGGHPVLSPEAAGALRPRTVFVMNPLYAGEVEDYLRQNAWEARAIVVE
jgi:SAM-dependent methyltransferase